MNWKQGLREWVGNQAILLCIGLIIGPLIILASVFSVNPYAEITTSLLRIIAGAGGGGLLTITIINVGSRRRSRRAYRAIIGRLCNLSINIYANFKYGMNADSGEDETIFNLARGSDGNIDASNDIENMASLLHSQASHMSDKEYYSVPYKQKIIYDIKDLVNIFFRDAIYSTDNEEELEQLYSANSWGLQFIGSSEGWGTSPADSLSKDQLYLLCFFLDACLPLYRSNLKKCGVPMTGNGRIEHEWQKPHA